MGQISKSEIAFINECKGYLFEYGLAQALSHKIKDEKKFLNNTPQYLYEKILDYQTNLMQMKPDYLDKIRRAIALSAQELETYLEDVIEIKLVGKIQDTHDESDLILVKKESTQGISLKLSFKNSDLHTKSAGFQSIILKYFGPFFDSAQDQENLNELLAYEYKNLALKLYQIEEIEPSIDFKNWVGLGYPTLPGDLNKDHKTILHGHYEKLCKELTKILAKYHQRDPKIFIECLYPLLGMSSNNLLTLSAQILENQDIIQIKSEKSYKSINQIEFSQQKSYLDLNLYTDNEKIVRLKLRIKPMNEFVQPGVKVNASIKF